MLIRSQDKTTLFNITCTQFINIGECGKGAMIYVDNLYLAGKYSTREKAMKVLDMIQEAYCKFMSVKNDDAWNGKESVFYMPEDSEVVA